VFGTAAIAGGVGVTVKKIIDNKKAPTTTFTVPQPPPEPKVQIVEPVKPDPQPQPYKPKGATRNIFNLDPNDPTSITARNPGIVHTTNANNH